MPNFLGRDDIMLTLEGDLVIDESGDFRMTTGFDWLAREMNKRVRTINPEWKQHPTIGANVETFAGRMLNHSLLAEIKNQITDSITRWGLQEPGDIDVRVVPVSHDEIAIYIFFTIAGVRQNLSKLVFNFDNGNVQYVEDRTAHDLDAVAGNRNTNPTIHRPQVTNKYLRRIHGGS
jgi:hypothetical protein